MYLTGHGGDEFLKFQDTSQLMAQDLADAVAQMAEKQRCGQVLFCFCTVGAERGGRSWQAGSDHAGCSPRNARLARRRYGQMFIMVESCEAFTQVQRIQAPGVIAVGSSIKGA